MIHLLMTAVLLCAPAPAADPAREAEATASARRTQFLVESLQHRIPFDRPLEAPLKEILDYLEDEGKSGGSDPNPLLRVKIVANDAAFKKVKGDTFEVLDVAIKMPKVPKATLETALEVLCEQLGATIVVRRDYIELMPVTHYFGRELAPGESPFLVNYFAARQPLDEVLDKLAERYGRTVLLDPKAADKGHEIVNAKLLNVPFESAIELLADLSGLKVVRKGTALLVTTVERAKALGGELVTPSRATLKSEKTAPIELKLEQ